MTEEIQTPELKAGETFFIQPLKPNLESLYFDNYKLTRINESTFFGAVPLYKDSNAVINAFQPVKHHWLEFPHQVVSFSLSPITVRELHNPSAIRIPANFFDELQKIETDQIEKEKLLIKSSLIIETEKPFCLEMQLPMKSKQVSSFGSYRRLPTGMKYFHTGLDLRAAVGKSVYAMADGEVALAQKFVVAGNAVIINHGNSLFSKYYHLSEILVSPGQKVRKGDLVGKSGGTGRVEAPHLHWEVSWRGLPTDPLKYLETARTICSDQK